MTGVVQKPDGSHGFEAAIDAMLARLGAALDVDAVRFETTADAEHLDSTTRVWTRRLRNTKMPWNSIRAMRLRMRNWRSPIAICTRYVVTRALSILPAETMKGR